VVVRSEKAPRSNPSLFKAIDHSGYQPYSLSGAFARVRKGNPQTFAFLHERQSAAAHHQPSLPGSIYSPASIVSSIGHQYLLPFITCWWSCRHSAAARQA